MYNIKYYNYFKKKYNNKSLHELIGIFNNNILLKYQNKWNITNYLLYLFISMEVMNINVL